MSEELFPSCYESWKYCITVKCKISLTTDFIQSRINSMSDESSGERRRFIKSYGTGWTNTVINYFRKALDEITSH